MRITGNSIPLVQVTMANVRILAITLALAMSTGGAAADTHFEIPTAAIPALKCIHALFQSSPSIQSDDLYLVSPYRMAIEYRIKVSDGSYVIEDLMLRIDGAAPRPIIWGIAIPKNESKAAERGEEDFISKLDLSSKCKIDPGFDNVFPGPKPRAEWQHIEWSRLSPAPMPSLTS